jgi:hypothetical protein
MGSLVIHGKPDRNNPLTSQFANLCSTYGVHLIATTHCPEMCSELDPYYDVVTL